MPIKSFDPEAAKLMRGISIELVRKAQEALEDLKETQMRCNDSLEDKVVESFPVLHEELSTFLKLCGYYKTNIQSHGRETSPIRGKEDESSLEKVFEDGPESPFNHEKLNKWLSHKEREINVIKSCVDTMEGVKIVLNQTELDREVLASGVEDVLCFVFTSMLKGLKNNSKFRFLITAKTNDNYKGATIYHYKKGQLVTEDFQKPSSVRPSQTREI
ncbi:hypothetical protein F7725_013773 [Dissostichus mawsoni]|uniref:Uncharacterized protein n=1 Tax=Dissostichus mawsoni TaxID=36200 RepID=A0A7J5YUB8_DISMA|nr:hypothetical protein F7725_013773 [Dissostichus mawsoni]